jgi:hypothetical protein
VVYLAKVVEKSIPEPTRDALREGLKIELFSLDKLPADMIFSDKEKIEKFARKSCQKRISPNAKPML